jgi:hypothetical protein
MNWRNRIPTGRLGRRIRKTIIAATLWYFCNFAMWRLRDPVWYGWTDSFTSGQLFFAAPSLFFVGAAIWQPTLIAREWFRRKAPTEPQPFLPTAGAEHQRTATFWVLDSLHILATYVTACLVGDLPMVVRSVSLGRGLPFHIWWSHAVDLCLLLTVATWWFLNWRFARQTT